MENGLKDSTMDDVAAYLGKSKATIYKYFPSREELIREGLAMRLEAIQQFIPILQANEDEYLDRYYKAMETFLEGVGDISNRFLSDLKSLFPELWQQVETFRNFSQMVLHQYYLEGIQQGKLKALHPGLLAQMDQFLFESLTDGEFLSQQNLTLSQAFSQYFEIKFFGAMKEKLVF